MAFVYKEYKMGIGEYIENNAKMSALGIISSLLIAYFTYFGISGERGLLTYLHLQQEISNAQRVAEQYAIQKTQLEEKVQRLSNSSLDLDLLEERARVVLNLVNKDDFILLDTDI